MSKRQYKAQASSDRAVSANVIPVFGGANSSITNSFGKASSPLSYLAEQPNLTALSDPNIVVIFKNLSKKDSITKARGLSDLQSHLSGDEKGEVPMEDALLDAWVSQTLCLGDM